MLLRRFVITTGVPEDPPLGRVRFGEIGLERQGTLRGRPSCISAAGIHHAPVREAGWSLRALGAYVIWTRAGVSQPLLLGRHWHLTPTISAPRKKGRPFGLPGEGGNA